MSLLGTSYVLGTGYSQTYTAIASCQEGRVQEREQARPAVGSLMSGQWVAWAEDTNLRRGRDGISLVA